MFKKRKRERKGQLRRTWIQNPVHYIHTSPRAAASRDRALWWESVAVAQIRIPSISWEWGGAGGQGLRSLLLSQPRRFKTSAKRSNLSLSFSSLQPDLAPSRMWYQFNNLADADKDSNSENKPAGLSLHLLFPQQTSCPPPKVSGCPHTCQCPCPLMSTWLDTSSFAFS